MTSKFKGTTDTGGYLLPKRKWSEGESHSVVSDSLRPHGLYPWNSPGQNTGVGSLSLLQQIFPTRELNWGLLGCRGVLYQLSCEGSPSKKKGRKQTPWVLWAFIFSSKEGRKKNPTELMEVMLSKVFVTGSMPQPVSLPALMSLSAASKNVKIIVSLFGEQMGLLEKK